MIKTLITASTLALIAVPAAALAQDESRGYASLGYSQIDTEQAVLGAVTVRGGWKVLPFIAVEGEASVGVEDDTYEISIDGPGAFELKHDVAAYAVAYLPLGEHVELFARAGYGSTSIESTRPAVTVVGDGESFSYGLGAAAFYGADGVRADWTRKDFTDNGGEADSWSVSYVRRF